MKIRIIFFFVLLSQLLFSQGEASNWYFGDQAGIKFHPDGSVTALTDGILYSIEGSSTISDASGQLLFYTNGTTVCNRNHQVMPNGDNLLGNFFNSTQSATIIQKPGSLNLYYIITIGDYSNNYGLRYSVVDMNLNGGLGDVTSEKNVLLLNNVREKLSVVKKANGIDYWLVTILYSTNQFFTFSLTSSGINITPVISFSGNIISDDASGYLKFSPKGNKLVMCDLVSTGTSGAKAQLFDFDNVTGLINNPIDLLPNNDNNIYGAEFSPNGEVLYVSGHISLYQFNMNATNIQSSVAVVSGGGSALQLGPNGKIYIAYWSSYYLSHIDNPNQLGAGLNIIGQSVYLDGRICRFGLPAFSQSYFFTPSIHFF